MQIHKFPPAVLLSSSCLNSHKRHSTKTRNSSTQENNDNRETLEKLGKNGRDASKAFLHRAYLVK
ncbi:hypothetical protein PanWU01x14_278250 [Parasponia andersonii]|uniref:Uncharacterized protein n=1 Tax=Parasponia andersonii TaxID=3476 RepID=A0A2P5B2E2_PARAD|nr:hypothetical protein PanWU01x14_278250 [Parasponia andersonii]